MALRYFVIDAFATERFTGNPAAVVMDADRLGDAAMRAIAVEFNLSETTFVLKPEQKHGDTPAVRFRWFTPAAEVRMCGHATIAGIQALLEVGRIRHDDPATSTVLRIETKSGVLNGFVESMPDRDDANMIWLDLPDPVLTPMPLDLAEWASVLNAGSGLWDVELGPTRTQDDDVMLFVRDFGALNSLRPNFAALGELLSSRKLRGLCVATVQTVTPSVAVQSRFFAPNFGINEDPVTGSVHGPLTAYLVDRGLVELHEGLAGLMCIQGIPGGRTGLLRALVQPQGPGRFGVRIGGSAVVVMSGTLFT